MTDVLIGKMRIVEPSTLAYRRVDIKEPTHVFPGHPKPRPMESLSSWFGRFARSNGLTETEMGMVFLPDEREAMYDWDVLSPGILMTYLERAAGLRNGELRSHTLTQSRINEVLGSSGTWHAPWRIDRLHSTPNCTRQIQVCVECLRDDDVLQLDWVLALNSICLIHTRPLIAVCAFCIKGGSKFSDDPRTLYDRMRDCKYCRRPTAEICSAPYLAKLVYLQELLGSHVRGAMAGNKHAISSLMAFRKIVDLVGLLSSIITEAATEASHSRVPDFTFGSCTEFAIIDDFERRCVLEWISDLAQSDEQAFAKIVESLRQIGDFDSRALFGSIESYRPVWREFNRPGQFNRNVLSVPWMPFPDKIADCVVGLIEIQRGKRAA